MRRRDALKQIGFATSFFVATPAVMSILQSCTSESSTWVPEFFSQEQGVVLTNFVDVILPKTEIPSATELNVPQFIDKYVNEVLESEQQQQINDSFNIIIGKLKTNPEEHVKNIPAEKYKTILDKYMLIKGEKPENIAFGSTLSKDGFSSLNFDFMLSNPPYGKTWKLDVDAIVEDRGKKGKDSRSSR